MSYAKRMAQGYLRSMGMGEWTPKINAPDAGKNKPNAAATTSKPESGVTSVPKSRNDIINDDLDFDF